MGRAELTQVRSVLPIGVRAFLIFGGVLAASVSLAQDAKPAQKTDPATEPPAQQPIFPKDPAQKKAMEDDIAKGKEYAKEVEKTLKFSKDTKAQERLERVGKVISEIARANQVKVLYGDKRLSAFGYRFRLIEGKDVNAFSIPGGNIYVNEGLMNFVESDDELAGVLAHEISHAAFRHYATMQKDSNVISALSLPILLAAILARNDTSYGAAMAINMAGNAFMSGWSVQAESAADYGAVQFLAKSPYQPVAMLSFMERLGRRETGHADWTIYTTHPPSELRAHQVLDELRELKAPIKRSLVTRSFRARVEAKPGKGFELWFGDTLVHTFNGSGGEARANDAVPRMNDFLDTVPEMYHVSVGSDGTVQGRGQTLFTVSHEDSSDFAADLKATTQAMRRAVFVVSVGTALSGRAGQS